MIIYYTIFIPLGLASVLIGLQGFRAKGMPLTTRRRITGAPSKIIGVICILFGLSALLPLFIELSRSGGMQPEITVPVNE